MSYGLELYNRSGRLFYSTEFTTWNYLGHFTAKAGQAASMPFSVLDLKDPNDKSKPLIKETLVQQSFLNVPPSLGEPQLPSYIWSGSRLDVSAQSKVDSLYVVLGR